MSQFQTQLGAHVALHALRSAQEAGATDLVKEAGERFQSGLQEIVGSVSFLKRAWGRGLLVWLEPNPRDPAVRLLGTDLFSLLLRAYLIREARVLVSSLRLSPPLLGSPAAVDGILERMRTHLCGVSGWRVASRGLWWLFKAGVRSRWPSKSPS